MALPDQIGFGIPEQYQNAIMNPIFDQLENRVIPGIHTGATAQGAFGGSRMQQQKADATQQATEAATNAMIQGNLQARGQSIGQRAGDINAQLANQGQNINQRGQDINYNLGNQQQLIGQRAGDISAQLQGRSQDINQNQLYNQALQQGLSGANLAQKNLLTPGDMQQQVGGARTAYEQQLMNADKAAFDWTRMENNDYVDRLFNRLQGVPLNTAGAGTVQGQSGNWTDILSGGLQGMNLWNQIGQGTK
jgi:hypothetical protein